MDCDTIPIKRIDSLIEKYDDFGGYIVGKLMMNHGKKITNKIF